MNLDGLRVNHSGLDKAAEDLYGAVKKIDDRMDRLENELAPLRSDWSGQAQEAYKLAKAKWDWALKEMRDLLDETSKTVYQSNDEYRAADCVAPRASTSDPHLIHASGGTGRRPTRPRPVSVASNPSLARPRGDRDMFPPGFYIPDDLPPSLGGDGTVEIDPEALALLKQALADAADLLETSLFRDLDLAESAFGARPSATELGAEHRTAHAIIADTISGVINDLWGYRDGVERPSRPA